MVTALPFHNEPIEIQTDFHTYESKRIIIEACQNSHDEAAVILGCGRCGEIPLRELANRFQKIDLLDINGKALQFVEQETITWNSKNKLKFYHDDLTGVMANVQSEAQQIVSENANPMICLRQLGDLLKTTKYNFWTSPEKKKYDLVICSMVLTQLQAVVRESIEKIYLQRFPNCLDALTSDVVWCKALWSFARDIEEEFISHLKKLTRPNGIIYLSATVNVSWMVQTDEESVIAEGHWIATKSSQLLDYLGNDSEVVKFKKWNWLRQEEEGEYWGRLYGVQALIYR